MGEEEGGAIALVHSNEKKKKKAMHKERNIT